ncbi:MAG: lysophospholipid acyltransferase family protein [Bacteroidota bacterium]
MGQIIFYITLPLLYLLSVLPLRVLYVISDIFYFIIFHVIGYRRKVVQQNLKNAFPEKSAAEILKIEKDFYQYFCDLFLETFQTLSISRKKMLRHCVLNENAKKLFDDYYAQKKSVVIVMGHYGNWEWAGNTFSLLCKHQLYVIYHPLANKNFNNLIIKMRKRFGTDLIPMKETFKEMVKKRGELSATAFIADQTPSPDNAYWTQFLHQDTPVFWGTEKIAQKMNYPVVFVKIKRIKRGYYGIFAETIFENPAQTVEGEISEKHTRQLENDIKEQPEIWLWSHRRWKHQRPGS